MKKLMFIILMMPMTIFAQGGLTITGEKGIKWTTGLGWEQVKQKAKQENKFIFLDCYTTWCGPCKMMDQQIFPDAEVGNYFNDKLISVKIQMDKTAKDDNEVRSWYNDAEAVSKLYHVEGYPSFIFLSPDGIIVSKETGAREKHAFLEIARTALVPGRVYVDPYADYAKLKENYLNGIKNYDRFPYMIQMAYKGQDDIFGKQLLEEHTAYVMKLKLEERYSKENIELWAGFMLKSDGQRFKVFYKDGNIIDKVMQEKGYSAKIVDRTVWNEIVTPFLEKQATGSGVAMSGMMLGGPGTSRLKQDHREADWKQLEKLIRQKFSPQVRNRNVLAARIEWYARLRNYEAYLKYYLIKLKRYTPDYSREIGSINNFIWETFLHITDKKLLNKVIPWGQKAVELVANNSDLLDSYANLLYKAGRTGEALGWQEKAVQLDPLDTAKQDALDKMKKNAPTYLNAGAIWME